MSLSADPFKHHMDEELNKKDVDKILAHSKSTSQVKVIIYWFGSQICCSILEFFRSCESVQTMIVLYQLVHLDLVSFLVKDEIFIVIV